MYINFPIYTYLWSIYLFEYTFYCCLFIVLRDGFLKSILRHCVLYFDNISYSHYWIPSSISYCSSLFQKFLLRFHVLYTYMNLFIYINLGSENERWYVIFIFMNMAFLSDSDLKLHPYFDKQHNFFSLSLGTAPTCICTTFVDLLICGKTE